MATLNEASSAPPTLNDDTIRSKASLDPGGFKGKGDKVTATHAEDAVSSSAPVALRAAISPPPVSGKFSTPRVVLVSLDAAAIGLAWVAALLAPFDWPNTTRSWMVVALSVAMTGALLLAFDLYKSRVSSVRSAELAAISRVAAILIPSVLFVDLLSTRDLHTGVDLTAGIATFLFLIIGRSIFDGWIRTARSQGRYTRSVVVVGAGPGAKDLIDMLADHDEAGYRVKGVVARRSAELDGLDWLGEPHDVVHAMATVGANGAFVVVDELNAADRSFVVEQVTSAGHHLHLTMGIAGIASQRVQLAPVVHEPLLKVDRPTLQGWQLALKRVVDVVVATVALIIATPLLMMAALAIKATDRGPVLFRQERVGLGGRTFTLLKLRTMAVDAEDRLEEVRNLNVRAGPLLKVERDPRVTRVGHFLRFTSIDELPQLFNVLKGQMSLVGPRPALEAEVASFDDELRERHNVLPGITGLWQVEARDNPSFSSYRRLDLFYVKNWSISLDLVILILTVQSVLVRAIKSVVSRGDAYDPC